VVAQNCAVPQWARQAGRGLVVDQLLACLIIGWQYLLIRRDTLVLLRRKVLLWREGGIRVYIVRDLLTSRTPVRIVLSAVTYRKTVIQLAFVYLRDAPRSPLSRGAVNCDGPDIGHKYTITLSLRARPMYIISTRSPSQARTCG
jgi:hypothetical protein